MRAGKGSQRVTRLEGESFIVADNDSNARRNQETEKLRAYQREREMQRRGVKIDDAIRGITDDDRKAIINKSLRQVNSSLSAS